MNYNIIKKYAQSKSPMQFIRGWQDKDGNIAIVISFSGKKFGFVKFKDSGEWFYWTGFGSTGITPDMPAGRGDYIIDKKLEPELSFLAENIISAGVNLERIDSTGASWAPTSQSELNFLAKLIDTSAEVNKFLSDSGILYPGSDKLIYGQDISGDDVFKFKIKAPAITTVQTTSGQSPTNRGSSTNNTKSISRGTSGIFGGNSPRWITNSVGSGYQVGPQHHMGRSQSRADRYKADPERNWYSDNAWDVLNPAGTQIYSLTDGRVTTVKESSSSAVNIYGTQIIVAGENGYPDIFYTHTEDVSVKPGDEVRVGDPIAKIGMPKTKEMPHHVHVGLPPGVHISSLMSENGSFKFKAIA
jgi:murein DD-endopeptidase MepM/ murein hydrolase activator NlpD